MNNKIRQLILVLGIMFVIGAATGITVQQILISQINQTNGEKFTEGVMPASYITNTTVNFFTGNASNLTAGVLPNASIPRSAANVSAANNNFTGTVTITGSIGLGTTTTPVNRITIGGSRHLAQEQGYIYGWADDGTYVGVSQGFNWNGTAVLLVLQSGQDFYVGSSGAGNDIFAGAFTQYSSQENKTDIVSMGETSLNETMSNFYRYRQKNDTKIQYGVLAGEENDITTTVYSNELGMNVTGVDIVSLFTKNLEKVKRTLKRLDNQKLDKDSDSANMQNLIVQNKFVLPKYAILPDIYPIGGEAYNTTDNTKNIMKPDGWHIEQTTKRQ